MWLQPVGVTWPVAWVLELQVVTGGLGALGLPPGFRNVKDLARSCAGIVTSQRRSGAPHQTPSGRGSSLGVCGPQCLPRLRTASAPCCLRPAGPVLVSGSSSDRRDPSVALGPYVVTASVPGLICPWGVFHVKEHLPRVAAGRLRAGMLGRGRRHGPPTGPAHVQPREGFPPECVVARSGALGDPVLWIRV